jgi:hypothetical protein
MQTVPATTNAKYNLASVEEEKSKHSFPDSTDATKLEDEDATSTVIGRVIGIADPLSKLPQGQRLVPAGDTACSSQRQYSDA